MKKIMVLFLVSFFFTFSFATQKSEVNTSPVVSQEDLIKASEEILAEYNLIKEDRKKDKYRNDALTEVVKQISPELPIKMSEDVSWTTIQTKKDGELKYTYVISELLTNVLQKNNEMKKELEKSFEGLICDNPMMVALLKMGAKVEMEIVNKGNGKAFSTVKINKKTC
jgi:hypothetical protein